MEMIMMCLIKSYISDYFHFSSEPIFATFKHVFNMIVWNCLKPDKYFIILL